MANLKIFDLQQETTIDGANDFIEFLDTSDTSTTPFDGNGSNKKITPSDFAKSFLSGSTNRLPKYNALGTGLEDSEYEDIGNGLSPTVLGNNLGGTGVNQKWGSLYISGSIRHSTDFTIHTAGSLRLTLDTAGNLGVGENTPSARLDVKATGTTSGDIGLQVKSSVGSTALVVKGDRFCGLGGATGPVTGERNSFLGQTAFRDTVYWGFSGDDGLISFASGTTFSINAFNGRNLSLASGNQDIVFRTSSNDRGRFDTNGYLVYRASTTAIADGALNASEMSAYLNGAETDIIFKVKTSGGTVKTGTVAIV